MAATSPIPTPEAQDHDDVTLALETAGALWNKGEAQDAIRWLRRAAEAAEEAGDDMRSLALARKAADLTTDVQTGAAKPGRPAPAVETTAPKPGIAAAVTASRGGDPAGLQPASSAAARSSVIPAAPRALEAEGDRGSSVPKKAPPPPSASKAPGSSPVAARPSVLPKPPPTPSVTPSSPRAAPAPSAVPGKNKDAFAELMKADGAMSSGPTRGVTSPTALRGVRVAVAPSGQDDGMLVVKVLGDDEVAPSGFRNAMLVATEPVSEHLFRRS